MSFSVEFPNWNVFSEREVVDLGADVEIGTPAGEVAALLRTYQEARRETGAMLEREGRRWLDALVQQAIMIGQFDILLRRYDEAITQLIELSHGQLSLLQKSYRTFRIQQKKMSDELGKFDILIEIPMGKTYRDIENIVTVDGWKHHQDYTQEIVVEVIEPVVYFKGMLVHQGRVIMGGPLQTEDESSISFETRPA